MPAVEWKLNAMIEKNEKLITKLKRNWRHPLVRKIDYVPILYRKKEKKNSLVLMLTTKN